MSAGQRLARFAAELRAHHRARITIETHQRTTTPARTALLPPTLSLLEGLSKSSINEYISSPKTRAWTVPSTMSYTFTILSPTDTPLFTHEFGTSRSGGDGVARFTTSERALNPFILHSALDIVEEVQWGPSTSSGSAPMYLKHIDKYQNNFISCWITGANVRFLLLTRPRDEALGLGGSGSQRGSLAGGRAGLQGGVYSPTSPATEEAVKNFFVDVHEVWVKCVMNPFFHVGNGDVVKSPVFRARVAAAAKKYL